MNNGLRYGGMVWVPVCLLAMAAYSDVVLVGCDLPNPSVMDGDFEAVKAGWRNPGPSPHWTTAVEGDGWGRAGFALGKMMNTGVSRATFKSRLLDHTALKELAAGDVLAWRFASNTEYPCDGRVSLAFLFGDEEREVVSRVQVPNGPAPAAVYEGFYTVNEADAAAGLPRVLFTLETTHGIKVYVDWFDLTVLRDRPITHLAANPVEEGIALTWDAAAGGAFDIYRSEHARHGFERRAEGVARSRWVDPSAIPGKTYFYAVKRGAAVSRLASVRATDSSAPAAPHALHATGGDWTVRLGWETSEPDTAYYKVYRGDRVETLACIAPEVKENVFEDLLPVKSADNVYAVMAVDYSGNEGPLSTVATARTKTVRGASFSDRILPMPIHGRLRSDIWGAEGVVPRDPDNGVEDDEWSYWGGKAVYDPSDGKYHMNVVRWPEGHRKGHWAWPESTVAYVVAEDPTGPYEVVRARAYDYKKGLGHNANLICLNDGTYALYSLIDWKPVILTADKIGGPWSFLGEMTVHAPEHYKNAYRLERNLSGVQCADGSFLFVTKAGAMMRSTKGILGPYEVLTGVVGENQSIPARYRNSNYEDPTMWYDGVQYHMIINAFLDHRAIYLRSPDGVDWKYEDGFAYTPTCTLYEDGSRTFWYKVERPNVLQDEFGRATHLSLAAVDVKKSDDFGNDAHGSKHLIIPLVVPKRLTLLNHESVTAETREVRMIIHAEAGFDPMRDLDGPSLRFGASEDVNYGRGAKLKNLEQHPEGALLTFGAGNGLSEKNVVGKLIGESRDGKLVLGYAKLLGE